VKKILFVVLTLMVVSALHADAFKFMGGVNLLKYSQVPKGENFQWNYKIGFCMGGGFEIDLTEEKIFSVEINAFYLQKKGARVEADALNDKEAVFNLSTLFIPALFRVKFSYDSPMYLFGGGGVSFILSHQSEIKEDGSAAQVDLKEDTKSVDFGLVFGFGYEIRVSRFQEFFIECRYHRGFANILRDSEEYGSVKTGAIMVVVGLKTY